MAETGILVEADRVELIDGEVVQMAPIGPGHQYAVDRLNRFLVQALGERAIVRVGGSFLLNTASEPEPDLQLLRPSVDGYAATLPGPRDVLLAIEVADSSLRYDREVKVPLYARAGIAEYWLLDLTGRTLTAYWEPTHQGYRAVRACIGGEALSASAFPDASTTLDELLPPLA